VRLLRFLLCCFFSASVICVHQVRGQQLDQTGSGRALLFDGTDDYIDLGNIYDDLALPVTVSVWVNMSPGAAYAFPIFNSQDNLPLYNGVTFIVSSSAFSIQYGDGMGENDPFYRRGKSASLPDLTGHWINVTGVMRSATDMDLYLNGINIGGQYGGNSPNPMSSMSPGDNAKIGYWHSNGITTYFKGSMDELRIFNRSLSESEIRQQMCKRLTGNETGLIGYWTFDEMTGSSLKDKSINHFDGILHGNPTRVYSGAPIGDESAQMYTSSWPGKSFGLDAIEAQQVLGNPQGLHVYKVNSSPSQTGGLDNALPDHPYYGVFIAASDLDNTFILKEELENGCGFFSRYDNSEPQWSKLQPSSTIINRIEVVPFGGEKFDLDLGPDVLLCDETSYQIVTALDGVDVKSIMWSNGKTTPSISVSSSGLYGVSVSSSCQTVKDTIAVQFAKKPPPFSLGADETLCTINPRVLKPGVNTAGYKLEWQDGSEKETFELSDFGTYYLTISNECGVASDTIAISKINYPAKEFPNVITPNDDSKNQYFVLGVEGTNSQLTVYNRWGEQVYNNPDYKDVWDGDDLPSGIYFYQITGNCIGEKKGTITISR